jgi:hypothetical protein
MGGTASYAAKPAVAPATKRRGPVSSGASEKTATEKQSSQTQQNEVTAVQSAQIVYGQSVTDLDSTIQDPPQAETVAAAGASEAEEQDIATQRSFTLYKKDCQAIRDAQVHFLKRGVHVTESQVVRIALRVLEVTEKLMGMHNQIRSEDGRRTRKGGKSKKARP